MSMPSPVPASDPPESTGGRHYSDTLSIHGLSQHPRLLSRHDLLEMAQADAGPISIACFSGRHIRNVSYVRGVHLTDILNAAGMQALPRSHCKKLIVAVHALDGYVCLFTWHELYNSPIGRGAMLLVEQDGEHFPEFGGGLQLVSLGDLRLGPRQALAVGRLEVRKWLDPVKV